MQLDYAIASAVLMLEHGFFKVQILVSGIAPPSRHDVWDPGNATRSEEAASRGTSFFRQSILFSTLHYAPKQESFYKRFPPTLEIRVNQ